MRGSLTRRWRGRVRGQSACLPVSPTYPFHSFVHSFTNHTHTRHTTVYRLEAELSRRLSLEGQCASLLEVVEEQQRMLLGMREQAQRQREEAQRAAAREAEWRGRAKVWQRERHALEKEARVLRFQLQRALA